MIAKIRETLGEILEQAYDDVISGERELRVPAGNLARDWILEAAEEPLQRLFGGTRDGRQKPWFCKFMFWDDDKEKFVAESEEEVCYGFDGIVDTLYDYLEELHGEGTLEDDSEEIITKLANMRVYVCRNKGTGTLRHDYVAPLGRRSTNMRVQIDISAC